MDLIQYIFPIYSGGTIIGQCFVADGYLITAAHVIMDFPACFTVINGKRFGFSNFYPDKHPVFIGEGNIHHDPLKIDVVIYSYDEIISPLKLSQEKPQKGNLMGSYSLHEVMDFTSPNPSHVLKMVSASANGEEEGNYFYCNCKQYSGSSGSPLLQGNEVIGIMHGGNDEGICAFLKAEVVSKMLSRIELSLDYDEWDLEEALEYDGCKYSKNKKRLLSGRGNTILEGTLVICNEAFLSYDYYGNYHGNAYDDIVIPDSVKKIGDRAFAWSKGLESVEIPNSVFFIGKELFSGCTFLKKVVLPKTITDITYGMFWGCQSLESIFIPNSVTRISEDAFDGCDSLSSIVIPENVTQISDLAFSGCTSLTQVIFLGVVDYIGREIFEGCEALSQIVIPSGTSEKYKAMLVDFTELLVEDKYIGKGYNPFEWLPVSEKFTLEEICDAEILNFNYSDIQDDYAVIKETKLSDGSNTLRIIIPLKDGTNTELKACKGIQKGVVEGDKIKVSLIHGQELHKVGKLPIVRYDVWESEEQKNDYLRKRDGEDLSTEVTEKENLSTEVSEEDLVNAWTDEYGVMYSKDWKRLLKAPQKIKEYTILRGTKVICDYAFGECYYLKSIVLTESVISIGKYTFGSCESLTTIELPPSISHIGDDCFLFCSNLISIKIPNGMKKKFSALLSDNINELNEIGDTEIHSTKVTKGAIEDAWTDNHGVKYSRDGRRLLAAPKDIKEYTVRQGTEIICDEAFKDCKELISIIIPKGVTTIGDYAFMGCTKLSDVKHLHQIKYGWCAFEGCERIPHYHPFE